MRFRLSHAGGGGNGEVFTLHGHSWQEEPYENGSTVLGDNRASQWLGSRGQVGVWNSFDVLLESAGGANKVTGDYLYRSFPNGDFQHGAWGIFKVSDGNDVVTATGAQKLSNGNYKVHGFNTVDPTTGKMADNVTILASGKSVEVPVAKDGSWEFTLDGDKNHSISEKSLKEGVTITSSAGGVLHFTLNDARILAEQFENEPEAIPADDLIELSRRKPLTEIGIKRGRLDKK